IMNSLLKLNKVIRSSKMVLRSMSSIKLAGVLPPIPTPFNAKEDIDFDKLQINFEVWNKHSLAGYVVIGTNGESASLTLDEKAALVTKCRQLMKPGSLLVAGAGCETTRATLATCERLVEAGADALLVLNPSFFRNHISEEALYDHYMTVAKQSPRPIILYNMPASTGYDLPVSLMARLADHPNIAGVKDSSGDVVKLATVVDAVRPGFQVLSGTGSVLHPGLQLGCVGGVCAIANVLPGPTAQLYHLHCSGDHEAAAQLQRRIIGPNGLVTRRLGVPGLKAAMELFGMYGGPCRLPLVPLSKEKRAELRAEFERNGFQPVSA
ncbi:hypothetical protein BOX15_Mlig014805g1, partial [Macrostomum lignano]